MTEKQSTSYLPFVASVVRRQLFPSLKTNDTAEKNKLEEPNSEPNADGSSTGEDAPVSETTVAPYFPPLTSFPVIELIIEMLDVLDLLAMMLTCKKFSKICQLQSIWRQLCIRYFADVEKQFKNLDPHVINSKNIDWRVYFYHRSVFLSETAVTEWITNPYPCRDTLPSARQSLTGTWVDGKVVYIGGQTSVTSRFDEIYYFDPVSMDFTRPGVRGDLPKFARHTAVAIGHKIYVFGGYDGFGTFFGLALYDVDTGNWSYPKTTGNPPIPRTNHAATSIGNKMYLFGGNDTTRTPADELSHGTYGDFVVFDAETSTWSEPETTGKPPCARSGHHMVAIGSKLYLFGGGLWNNKTKTWMERYSNMFVLDINTMVWEEVNQINVPSQPFISLPHWVVAQFIFVYNDPLFCFDTVTSTWSQVKTIAPGRPQKRFLGPATVIPNLNMVYMWGGVFTSAINFLDQLTWPRSIYQALGAEPLVKASYYASSRKENKPEKRPKPRESLFSFPGRNRS